VHEDRWTLVLRRAQAHPRLERKAIGWRTRDSMRQDGVGMQGPLIFIATNRLKPGRLDSERARVPGLVDFIETIEPRLIAFNEYVNEAGDEVSVVQVH